MLLEIKESRVDLVAYHFHFENETARNDGKLRLFYVSKMKSIESARVTRASFDTDPIQAVSVFHHESRLHQRFAAIGCSSHVTIVRLDSNEISDYFSLALKGGGTN